MTTEHINPLKSYPFETNTQTEQSKTEQINFTPHQNFKFINFLLVTKQNLWELKVCFYIFLNKG